MRYFLLRKLQIGSALLAGLLFAAEPKPEAPAKQSFGYAFFDPSPAGAFATTSEQMAIAWDLFQKKGARAFTDRISYFNAEDQKSLEKVFGEISPVNLPEISFGPKEIKIAEHILSFKEKDFTIDGKIFNYDDHQSFLANLERAETFLAPKVSLLEKFFEAAFLPFAQAATKKLTRATAALTTVTASTYSVNRNPSGALPESSSTTSGGTHKSFSARVSGAFNYVGTKLGGGPTQKALDEGLAAAKKFSGQYKNQRYMILVDYANCRNQNSFFVIDLQSGSAIRNYRIPTAYGSTDSARMCTNHCSDKPESGASEGGAMVTTEGWGQGSHTGEGIALKGLETKNQNTQKREIKIHEGSYVDSGGNSAGCFVLSRPAIEDLKTYVQSGTFVYAANCPNYS